MSENITLVAGLPGSGKTWHFCTMLRDGWLVFDDFKANAPGDNPHFGKSRKFRSLINALADDLKCVVADIDFCNRTSRDQAEGVLSAIFPDARLVWHFFANDSAACEANIKTRNNLRMRDELDKLRHYSRLYQVPQGAVVLPVFRRAIPSDIKG